MILGGGIRLAVLVAAALILEQLVGDALLDVVGLAREDEQRLVLRLPAEAGDGPVVPVAVEVPSDAEIGSLRGGAGEPAGQLLLGGVVDEPESEGRRGNAEDDVVRGERGGEVRLTRGAGSRRIDAARDRVEPVDAAVGRAVRVLHETRLADRSVGKDERGHGLVASSQAIQGGESDLRIGPSHLTERRVRAGPADRRLRVAGGAAIGVESGTESAAILARNAARYRIDLGEDRLGVVEGGDLDGRESRERSAGIGDAAARSGIDLGVRWYGESEKGKQ